MDMGTAHGETMTHKLHVHRDVSEALANAVHCSKSLTSPQSDISMRHATLQLDDNVLESGHHFWRTLITGYSSQV